MAPEIQVKATDIQKATQAGVSQELGVGAIKSAIAKI
jgi:hypothetical protein